MSNSSVLILGGHDARSGEIAKRLRALGYRPVAAKTAEEALRLVEDPRVAAEVALLPPSLLDGLMPDSIDLLRARASPGRLSFIAFGRRPDAEAQERLSAAGVALVLFDPISDAALRFQVNRARGGEGEHHRLSPRVPTDWSPGFLQGSRHKDAGVYSLSAGGAFLSTPRPCLRGASVSIELPLPMRALPVHARVLYTNVTGNLRRASLPIGMAVGFVGLEPDDRERLLAFVAETASRYEL